MKLLDLGGFGNLFGSFFGKEPSVATTNETNAPRYDRSYNECVMVARSVEHQVVAAAIVYSQYSFNHIGKSILLNLDEVEVMPVSHQFVASLLDKFDVATMAKKFELIAQAKNLAKEHKNGF